jgi:squalene-hopene/tetraprenyl-beta-curcumene cyclase
VKGAVAEDLLPAWEATTVAVATLQAGWPQGMVFQAAQASIYDYFPYLFSEAFPAVAAADLQQLATAARMFASSIFLHDKVYDPPAAQISAAPDAPVKALCILAMQWEAYRILHRLFPPDATFWSRFQGYLTEFARACIEEHGLALGRLPWQGFTEKVALDIARGKNGIAKATVAGLAELARDDARTEDLTTAIDHYSVARQILDDLCDWKEDLQNGVPSLVLARVLENSPTTTEPSELAALIESVGREIYYGGHARYCLKLAIASLDEADRLTSGIPDLSWRKVNDELRRQCENLLQDAERIIHDNLRRAASQPELRLRLPPPASRWQRVAWDALLFVVEQWRLGFGEARHLMVFPRDQGFSAQHEWQRGDVFQRAVIADVLCDADEMVGGRLRPAIDYEISYLLSRRGAARGGWRYFPDLPELPPDADDLGQIMQVLIGNGRLEDVRRHCAGALSILLDDNRHRGGSFETWIIPANGRTPEEELQAHYARLLWGTGADPEVVANLLYALVLFDRSRFAETIRRGAGYLRRQQQDDGSWTSTWYRGPYYGTYACLRLLCSLSPRSLAVRRAAEFLCRTQHGDGGWGAAGESNALDTALALAGLATQGNIAVGHDEVVERAEHARAYLCRTRQEDGGWPVCEFIRMDTGRASGTVAPVLTYGSSTMTTTFVLKAALLWHRLTGSPSHSAERLRLPAIPTQ